MMGNISLRHSRGVDIDADTIRTYVGIVFAGLQGLVPVRMFPEKGAGGKSITPFVPADDGLAAEIVRHAAHADDIGFGLYVVPGTVARRRARAEDVLRLSTALVDLDVGDIEGKRGHLIEHLGPATLEVASGGVTSEGQRRRHIYWGLDAVAEATALAQVCEIRAEIARKVGGDQHFGSAHQPIRVPGSVHNKAGIRAARRRDPREERRARRFAGARPSRRCDAGVRARRRA